MPPKQKKRKPRGGGAAAARTPLLDDRPAAAAAAAPPPAGDVESNAPAVSERRSAKEASSVARYKVVERGGAVVRAGFEASSALVKPPLAFDSVIVAAETRPNDKGVTRVRFHKGWVSERAGDGSPLLQKLTPPGQPLAFAKGDTIVATRDVGDGWWEGHLEGKEDASGVFYKPGTAAAGGGGGEESAMGLTVLIGIAAFLAAMVVLDDTATELCAAATDQVTCQMVVGIWSAAIVAPVLVVLGCVCNCATKAQKESGCCQFLTIALMTAASQACRIVAAPTAPTDMVDRLIHPATGGAAIVAVVLGCCCLPNGAPSGRWSAMGMLGLLIALAGVGLNQYTLMHTPPATPTPAPAPGPAPFGPTPGPAPGPGPAPIPGPIPGPAPVPPEPEYAEDWSLEPYPEPWLDDEADEDGWRRLQEGQQPYVPSASIDWPAEGDEAGPEPEPPFGPTPTPTPNPPFGPKPAPTPTPTPTPTPNPPFGPKPAPTPTPTPNPPFGPTPSPTPGPVPPIPKPPGPPGPPPSSLPATWQKGLLGASTACLAIAATLQHSCFASKAGMDVMMLNTWTGIFTAVLFPGICVGLSIYLERGSVGSMIKAVTGKMSCYLFMDATCRTKGTDILFAEHTGGLLVAMISLSLVIKNSSAVSLLLLRAGAGPAGSIVSWKGGFPIAIPKLAAGVNKMSYGSLGGIVLGVIVMICGTTIRSDDAAPEEEEESAPAPSPAPAPKQAPAPAPAPAAAPAAAPSPSPPPPPPPAAEVEPERGRRDSSHSKRKKERGSRRRSSSASTAIVHVTADMAYEEGKKARANDQWEAAVHHFGRALDMGGLKDPARAMNQRGQCLERLGRWEAAFTDYDNAVKQSTDKAAKGAMHSNRGKAHAVLGRLQYAVADFDRAVELGYTKAAKRRDSLRSMLDAQTSSTPSRRRSKGGDRAPPPKPPADLDRGDPRFTAELDEKKARLREEARDPRSRRKSESRSRSRSKGKDKSRRKSSGKPPAKTMGSVQ